MARIVIFGASGMAGMAMGRELAGHGHRVIAAGRHHVPTAGTRPDLGRFGAPDVVINAAVVKNATDPDAAWVNAGFPHVLAESCRERDIPLIHLSSEAVLAASPQPRLESSPLMPVDAYGRQKQAGEPRDAAILRFSMIGPETRGFTGLLCWCLSRTGTIAGFTDHLWNGVSSLELAREVARLLEAGPIPGVTHLAGENVTKAELLRLIATAFGAHMTILPQASGAPRDQRLSSLSSRPLPPLAEQVAELAAVADGMGRWLSTLSDWAEEPPSAL